MYFIIHIEYVNKMMHLKYGITSRLSQQMMTGYHNNPEATTKAIDADGWFHTGDIALFEEGYFSIVDRIKDIIKVKAFQVSTDHYITLQTYMLSHVMSA